MPKLKRKTIIRFILAIVIVFFIIKIIPTIKDALTTTEVLKYGELKVSNDISCVIVRDETVYAAKESSLLDKKVNESTLVKKNSQVVKLRNSGKDSIGSSYKEYADHLGKSMEYTDGGSKQRGVVSYYIDGYEGEFTPDNIKNMKYSDVGEKDIEPKDVSRNETAKDDPIFKIADNGNWYLVFWIENDDLNKYKVGNGVTAELESGNVRGIIDAIRSDGSRWQIVVRTNRMYDDFAKIRRADIKMVTLQEKGLIISNKCLTTKNHKVVCYVKTVSGESVPMQVKVLATDGEHSVVADNEYVDKDGNTVKTVKDYDKVLKNPKAD